ncbi:coiled-coil domain-containing protein 91 isoform X1 [Cebus imitator]|uniref:Coiled-coil domain containing 91 n=1 Tax=Cebus imitator TaxID=2715852 RepID=A0A2K5PL53_CEBIM|nr:coiled-coil domain-containing protein 91 isoform X1 [Cebus imitator]XP_037590178.1 coiled-coil domain-containing protein 91 isoform X1 [Cebus imitator]XP_037590179.1 coiled-coil domain-containing protein 91 isoform X1 [Cebus imitator]XP_037590180.1 coiled-coil domain-containing protein 91 isoform X1 [Cebus imitator]XP_037590181.1 coiled-coil domain-containing protein 91 isoform X1 [Cebus imitator]
MDDDDFGGFEAAETFDGGNGETQTTSPAIPWAAFPTVSGVHLSPCSPEIVLDHDHSSTIGCLSSDAIILSSENTHAENSTVSQTISKAQIQQSPHTHLDISLFPLGLTDEKSNGTIALVDDCEDPGANVSNIQLRQKISSLEIKLKVSEEEKQRIKKDVESLMEKHNVLEKGFLKEKEQEAISFQDSYKELQEKHKQELEDMRKAGHEALSIIVDEYKALLQSSVKQQVEAIEKQYVSAIEKQAHKCEELLNAQHQRLLEMLDTEKELLKEKIMEALIQQSQEQKEILEKCLEEERQRNKEALVSAAKLEKEAMQDAVLKAIEEERKHLEKAHAEERELWKIEHAKDQEKVSQEIQKAIQEQRKISQETVKAAIIEEQKRSEKAVEEAVKTTRDELIEYIKEQKRLDQVIRQRSLSSLELFLSCAQKQCGYLQTSGSTILPL